MMKNAAISNPQVVQLEERYYNKYLLSFLVEHFKYTIFQRNQFQALLKLLLTTCLVFSPLSYAVKPTDHTEYCQISGGVVETMTVEYLINGRYITGLSKEFCNFYLADAFVTIGLETFATEVPNIAASYMQTLEEIPNDSPLWHGEEVNPSHNVCKNLGGALVSFAANGSFTNRLGQADMCVFGDGSMVSSWSLIYMANHREGYDDIKRRVRSESLAIKILETVKATPPQN